LLENDARQLRIAVHSLAVQLPSELAKAFDTAHEQHSEGMIVFVDIVTFVRRKKSVDLALKHQLPTVTYVRERSVRAVTHRRPASAG